MRALRHVAALTAAAALVAAAACGREVIDADAGSARPSPNEAPRQDSPAPQPAARLVDPRAGGFEVGFGEFAVALEAEAIRPGPVTFVVENGGELVHGFEMQIEEGDGDNSDSGSSGSGGGDSSGPGSGDEGFKVEKPTFDPGETIRFRLDLAPGEYKVECFVANHDDLGMEALLEVSPNAARVRVERAAPDAVSIQGFAFEPDSLRVDAGAEVTWTNGDPEQHTVTAEDGTFDSGPIAPGEDFRAAIDDPGTYAYLCSIHPTMKGTVEVG